MLFRYLVYAALVLSFGVVHGQDAAGAGVPVHMVVTVEGKHDSTPPSGEMPHSSCQPFAIWNPLQPTPA